MDQGPLRKSSSPSVALDSWQKLQTTTQWLCSEISPKEKETKEEKTWRKVGFKPRIKDTM